MSHTDKREKAISMESTGDILGNFIQSRAEGIPGDFHQQQDEKIGLSKPAPLPTEPPQARLLRENRC